MSASLKLLIVEDSSDDSELLLKHIRKGGYEPTYERVETEPSMAEALEKASWDVVLCDYHLPAFGALYALSLAKKKQPFIPFIIVSGSVSEEDAVLALKAGANDYILKNNMTRLIPAIEREINEAKSHQKHREVEATLKRKEAELRQAQKLEAVGQLAGGIAHDFNNMLAIILMQTDSMMDSINENPALKKMAEQIYKGLEQVKKTGDRATNLTRQLLAFSRKQVIQPKVLNLNEAVADIEKMLRRVVEENIEFKVLLSEGLWNIKVDPGHLEQILMNLVVNSRDAMQNGGTLTIQNQNSGVSEEVAQRCNTKAGDYVLLTVSDTGCGIDEETQKFIFDPFFTTKEIGKGTGLGLSTVYGIVKQNKGLIFVESKPGHGATFKIYFPKVDEEVKAIPIIKKNIVHFTGTETILVVEDEDDLRSLVCDALSENGYKVLSARNGVEALEIVKSSGSSISLVVTDVIMPQMGGPEFAIAAKNINKEIQFLFLSGYTENVLIQQGINTGQIHFLEKPCPTRVLLEKIRILLSNDEPVKTDLSTGASFRK